MSHVDATIARIPRMTPREMSDLLGKADSYLARKPGDREVVRLRAALLAALDAMPPATGRIVTGRLSWEPHSPHITRFRAYDGDREVGVITKHATHTGTRNGVYSVDILSQRVATAIHRVEEARAIGETAYGKLTP